MSNSGAGQLHIAPGWPSLDKFPKVRPLGWEKSRVLYSQLQKQEGANWASPRLGAVGVGRGAVLKPYSTKQAQLELGLDRSLILLKDTFRP